MEANKISDTTIGNNENYKNKSNSKLIGGATILGISGIFAVIAGIITARRAKRQTNEFLKDLGKEQISSVDIESPYALAFRALAWGTAWAVGGCSLIMFGIWKWYGFKDLNDLRTKARSRIRKSSKSDERTEFENLSDFLNYLNDMSKAQSKANDSKSS